MIWVEFILSTAVIVFAATQLTKFGDITAVRILVSEPIPAPEERAVVIEEITAIHHSGLKVDLHTSQNCCMVLVKNFWR
jgi:hypothetical protein